MVERSGSAGRRPPGWLWFIVPMLLSALVFGAIAVAVRSSGDDAEEAISGPAAQLPAVVAAAQDLLGAVPPDDQLPAALGRAYGEVTLGFAELEDEGDELEFAERFDRLPDAQARLLGRTLAEMQTQLSPTELGGARQDDDRAADIVFALALSRAMAETVEPDGTPREQALAVLPFSVQDLTGFDEIAATFAAGDLEALAGRIDRALTSGGGAELISSVANAVSVRLPAEYETQFREGYNTASG